MEINKEILEYIDIKSENKVLFTNLPEFDTEFTPMITPSEIIEYTYCPRFLFYMNTLGIPQHEELRLKVLKGRQLHRQREKNNPNYLRKNPECIKKDVSVYLASTKIRVRGIVDEVLHLSNGTLAPLDYKYTFYTDFIYKTHRIQSTLYALLIQEKYNKPVEKGYICYVRSGHSLKEVVYTPEDFKKALNVVEEIFLILQSGYYPKRTKYTSRCIDCTYRNICDKI